MSKQANLRRVFNSRWERGCLCYAITCNKKCLGWKLGPNWLL